MKNSRNLLPGTLDMLVLRTLMRGPQHGYGIAERVKELPHDVLHVGESSLYPALSFHRDAITRDLIARGYSPADARAAARRRMGNETLMREEARGVWLWPWLEGMWQDVRGAVRGLRRSPAFTAGVMLTFALGVGANAAMFSLIDRMPRNALGRKPVVR